MVICTNQTKPNHLNLSKQISYLFILFSLLCLLFLSSCSSADDNSPTNPINPPAGNKYEANGVSSKYYNTYKFYNIDGTISDITISENGINNLTASNGTSPINLVSSAIYSINSDGDSFDIYNYYLIYDASKQYSGHISFPKDGTAGYMKFSSDSSVVEGVFEKTQNIQRSLGGDSEYLGTWTGNYNNNINITLSIDKNVVSYSILKDAQIVKEYKIPSSYFIKNNEMNYENNIIFIASSSLKKDLDNLTFIYVNSRDYIIPSVDESGKVTGPIIGKSSTTGFPPNINITLKKEVIKK